LLKYFPANPTSNELIRGNNKILKYINIIYKIFLYSKIKCVEYSIYSKIVVGTRPIIKEVKLNKININNSILFKSSKLILFFFKGLYCPKAIFVNNNKE